MAKKEIDNKKISDTFNVVIIGKDKSGKANFIKSLIENISLLNTENDELKIRLKSIISKLDVVN